MVSRISISYKYQVIRVEGLLPDYIINTIYIEGYKPTLIRGYRNARDIEESEQWLDEINEVIYDYEVDMVLIRGDSTLKHISSTFLRNLQVAGKDDIFIAYAIDL